MAAGTHAARSLAAWLLQYEGGDADNVDAVLEAAERTCQKLCTRLARLVTTAGCQLLLARAIHLAEAEAPFLQGVRAGTVPGPCLEGVQDSTAGATGEQARSGLVAMIAHLIGLLGLFIGDHLTRRLVHDVWPDAPLVEDGTGSAAEEASS